MEWYPLVKKKKNNPNIIDVALIVLFLEQVRWYPRSWLYIYTSPTVFYLFLVSVAWGTLDILHTLVRDKVLIFLKIV